LFSVSSSFFLEEATYVTAGPNAAVLTQAPPHSSTSASFFNKLLFGFTTGLAFLSA
jgi:hypothetical protein